jgi:hypothetical protein
MARKSSIYLDYTEDGKPILLPESRRMTLQTPDYSGDKEYCKFLTKHNNFSNSSSRRASSHN